MLQISKYTVTDAAWLVHKSQVLLEAARVCATEGVYEVIVEHA